MSVQAWVFKGLCYYKINCVSVHVRDPENWVVNILVLILREGSRFSPLTAHPGQESKEQEAHLTSPIRHYDNALISKIAGRGRIWLRN